MAVGTNGFLRGVRRASKAHVLRICSSSWRHGLDRYGVVFYYIFTIK